MAIAATCADQNFTAAGAGGTHQKYLSRQVRAWRFVHFIRIRENVKL